MVVIDLVCRDSSGSRGWTAGPSGSADDGAGAVGGASTSPRKEMASLSLSLQEGNK